jgi:hypothetical protein
VSEIAVPPELAGAVIICPFCERECDGFDVAMRHLWDDHPAYVRKGYVTPPPCGDIRPHAAHNSPPREKPDDEGYDWCPGVK